jgi:putative transposase
MTQRSPFRCFKISPEVIRLAVMLYVRFPLSPRNVEDLLHERGIEVSHETVRYWWRRFGPMFAAEIRQRRARSMRSVSRWRWHLDEVFVRVNGVQHYLWRAVDHEGEVLEAFVAKRRDKAAALKFLRKLMKRHGRPEEVVTDKLRSYGAALEDLGRRTGASPTGGRTTGPRTRTSRFEGGSELCCVFGACTPYRSSPLSTPRCTTTSTQTAASQADPATSRPAPPPLPSGGHSAPPDEPRTCPN